MSQLDELTDDHFTILLNQNYSFCGVSSITLAYDIVFRKFFSKPILTSIDINFHCPRKFKSSLVLSRMNYEFFIIHLQFPPQRGDPYQLRWFRVRPVPTIITGKDKQITRVSFFPVTLREPHNILAQIRQSRSPVVVRLVVVRILKKFITELNF